MLRMKSKRSKEPKKKPSRQSVKEEEKSKNIQKATENDSDTEESFSQWLKSNDGIDCMKLFVIGNSVLILFVLSWTHIQEFFDNAYYLYKDFFPDKQAILN